MLFFPAGKMLCPGLGSRRKPLNPIPCSVSCSTMLMKSSLPAGTLASRFAPEGSNQTSLVRNALGNFTVMSGLFPFGSVPVRASKTVPGSLMPKATVLSTQCSMSAEAVW